MIVSNVTVSGGITNDQLAGAQATGIDTSAAEKGYDIADTVAAIYAAGYGMETLNNLPGTTEAPINAAAGTTNGAVNTLAPTAGNGGNVPNVPGGANPPIYNTPNVPNVPNAPITPPVNPPPPGTPPPPPGTNMTDWLNTGLDIVSGVNILDNILNDEGDNQDTIDSGLQVDAPFAPYRDQFGQQLVDLYNDPSKIADTPGYKFSLSQGQEALARYQASKGGRYSGNALIEADQFAQDTASTMWDSEISKLMTLSGANFNPAGAGGNAATQTIGNTNLGSSQLGAGIDWIRNQDWFGGDSSTDLSNLWNNNADDQYN